MGDRGIRSCRRDRGKRQILELVRFEAEVLQGLSRVDLCQLARSGVLREPVQEPRHRRSIAQMGLASPLQLRLVLARLHQGNGIGAHKGATASLLEALRQPGGHGRRVEEHASTSLAEGGEHGFDRLDLGDRGQLGKVRVLARAQFLLVDEQGGMPGLRHQREGQRQRRMRHVGAPNVEEPRHRMRVGDEQGIRFAQRQRHPRELFCCRLPRELGRTQPDRAARRGRTIVPDRVDRVGADRDQGAARPLCGLVESCDLVRGEEPGVIAERTALKVRGQPGFRRLLGDRHGRDHRRVDLIVHGERIAPVHEDRRLGLEDDGEARRAGKAGQPSKPFLARRDVFALVTIRPRNDETVEPLPGKLLAQGRHPRGTLRTVRRFVEGLEAALEHRRRSL